MKIYIVFISLLTAVVNYRSFAILFRNKWIAVTASFFYVLSFYRLSNALVRGAIGEYSAMSFLPVAFCGLLIILENDERIGKGVFMLALGTACTLTTHNLSTLLLVSNLALILVLYLLVDHKSVLKKNVLWAFVKAVLLAASISAFFWFPMLSYLRTGDMGASDSLLSGAAKSYLYAEHALDLPGLFAFGPSWTREEVLGILIPIAAVLYALFLVYFRIRYGEKNKHAKTGIILLLLFAMNLLFSSKLGPWDLWSSKSVLVSKWISVLQFPFRYLSVETAVGTLLLGYLLKAVSEGHFIQAKRTLCRFGLYALLFLFGVNTFFYLKRIDGTSTHYRLFSPACFSVYLTWGLDASFELPDSFYLPSGTDISYYKGTIHNLPELNPTVIFTGDITRKGLTTTISCQNPSANSTILLVPYVMYPDYEARNMKDNMKLTIQKGPAAMAQVTLPGGFDGTVQVHFREPLSWRLAELVSLFTLMILIIIALFKKRYGYDQEDKY